MSPSEAPRESAGGARTARADSIVGGSGPSMPAPMLPRFAFIPHWEWRVNASRWQNIVARCVLSAAFSDGMA